MDYKKTTAPASAETRDLSTLCPEDGNIYESVVVISKRANQISMEIKEELKSKLQEFATYPDNQEEVSENREQIEISRFYEKLPKSTLIATQEFLDDQIYYRNPLKDKSKTKA